MVYGIKRGFVTQLWVFGGFTMNDKLLGIDILGWWYGLTLSLPHTVHNFIPIQDSS